jgi:O-antigen/teichoic acid export membrane protein
VTIAPWISEVGLMSFLSREHARRARPLGTLLGSTMPITFATSLVGAVLAVPLAHALGRGRTDVVEFIEIGLLLLPLAVFLQNLYGLAIANQHWGLIMSVQFASAGGTACVIVALSLLGDLTVKTVAATYIVVAILANLPFVIELRGSRPWRFARPVARTGLAFGIRSWLYTLANVGNLQLDQVLMAPLVSSRQLGLYSLAVTLASASGSLLGATALALIPRVATGDSDLVPRACRVAILSAVTVGIGLGATSPVFVPLVFGHAFDDMIPMLLILLGATVFAVGNQVLGSALIAGGDPASSARGQLAGLAITVPALIIVLPLAGGLGAAWVSLAAYGVTFLIVLRAAKRTFALPYRGFLVVTTDDFRWLVAVIRRSAATKIWPGAWARRRDKPDDSR